MAAGFRYAVSRCLLQAVQLIDQPSAGFELPAGLLVTVLQERMVFRRSVYLFEIAGAYRAVSIYSISDAVEIRKFFFGIVFDRFVECRYGVHPSGNPFVQKPGRDLFGVYTVIAGQKGAAYPFPCKFPGGGGNLREGGSYVVEREVFIVFDGLEELLYRRSGGEQSR